MKQLTLTDGFRLVPVVEVLPYQFSPRPLPTTPGARAHPQLWDPYFRACLADAGYAGVEPIAPGSHFVDLLSLVGHPLFPRLAKEDREKGGEGALDGGFALMRGDERLLEPGCCCSLSHFTEWEKWLGEKSPAWSPWYGHPVLAVKRDGARLVLTETWEYPPAPDWLVELTVSADAFRAALVEMRRTLEGIPDFTTDDLSRRLLGLDP
jgi:hypothetical protein